MFERLESPLDSGRPTRVGPIDVPPTKVCRAEALAREDFEGRAKDQLSTQDD